MTRDWLTPPTRRIRLPRRSVRLRLTLLYGALFLVSGAALLVITYALVQHATSRPLRVVSSSGTVQVLPGGIGATVRRSPLAIVVPGPVGLNSAQQQAQDVQIQAVAGQTHDIVMQQLVIGSGMALAVMAVVSVALGWIVAGRVLSPLRTIITTTRDISASNLDRRLAFAGPDDELKELGDTIDGLLARLETAFRSQRQFVANASHELRTPLARQRALIQVALSDPEPTVDSLRAAHERVLAAEEQQERLIEALLTLTRGQAGLERRERFDLAGLAVRVLDARREEAARLGLSVETTLVPAEALGDARLVERLVANLVDNALRHNVPRGRLSVATALAGGQSTLIVENTGPAIPADAIPRLLQPFQRLGVERTDHSSGLGLGLSIVQAIAVAHDAALDLRARPDGGLRVTVCFPPASGDPPAEREHRAPTAAAAPPAARPSISTGA